MNLSDTMGQISAMSWKMHEPNTSVSCIVSIYEEFFFYQSFTLILSPVIGWLKTVQNESQNVIFGMKQLVNTFFVTI